MKNELKILDKIQKVKTPPFLFTRIESKINQIEEPPFSFQLALSISLVLLLLTFVNFSVLKNNLNNDKYSDKDITSVVENISSSNNLYYE